MMNFKKDFCVLILTHGRPDNVITINALKKGGYTGKYFIVIDNEDKKQSEYIEKYGPENVIVFDKAKEAQTFDEFDNFNDRRAIVYARNASFRIAKELGYRYFLQLDDDYTDFRYKFDGSLRYSEKIIKANLDKIFRDVLTYYIQTGADTLSLAQGGDFIGAQNGSNARAIKTKRKAMNTFFCDTERPFKFIGRINEDVNTYASLQHKGVFFIQLNQLAIYQKPTQSNAGGMTDIYLDNGTYIKSFYSIICSPGNVKISAMGNTNPRLHHFVTWRNTAPKILAEKHKRK